MKFSFHWSRVLRARVWGIVLWSAALSAGFAQAGEADASLPGSATRAPAHFEQEFFGYQQASYQIVDPAGDLALLRFAEKILVKISEIALGFGEYTELANSREPEQCRLVPDECTPEAMEHHKEILNQKRAVGWSADSGPVLREAGFIRMLLEVIVEEQENGISPKMGIPHVWSGKFLKRHGSNLVVKGFPKILVALAGGVSSQYLRTDQEEALMTEVLNRPEDSVTIDEMFRMSYRLNYGDVYLALLTIENILSRQFLHADREILPVTRRLKGFLNGKGVESDRFGVWYHLFGVILYSYYVGDGPWISPETVAEGETWLASLLLPVRTEQKGMINLHGARLGAKLKSVLKNEAWKNLELNPAALQESAYLRGAR